MILVIITIVLILLIFYLFGVYIYDKFIQKSNLVFVNYPIIGRFRYWFHDLRPFFRQYFGDDNEFSPRIIID